MQSQIRLCCLIVCGTIGLSGCLAPARLNDGQKSGLSGPGAKLRNGLQPNPAPGVLPLYRPGTCLYEQRDTSSSGITDRKKYSISIDSVPGDKLFVRITDTRGESTGLIDSSGKQIDTNVIARDSTQRITPEGFDEFAEQGIKAHPDSPFFKNAHALNDFTAILPRFVVRPSRPNVSVANILMEKNQVWGYYVYRGVLQYHGVQAELLDLIHVQNGHPSVRGFLLFDTQHMLPLLFDINFGATGSQLEQVKCE